MPVVRLMHVNAVRRRGRLYYYHRKTGERLPDDTEARALRVLAINAGLERKPAGAGSFSSLIALYRSSADFTALQPQTRRDYERHLAALEDLWGGYQQAALRRSDVLELRDGLEGELGPRQANYRLAVLRRLLAFARERGLRPDNPAERFKRFREGPGYQAWPLDALRKALEAAYPELRLAIGFMFLTGLRPSDAARAAWSNLEPDRLTIMQGKTREPVVIPVGGALAALLEAAPRKALTILATKSGRPWRQNWLSREVASVTPRPYSPHGLRETAATMVAAEGDAAIQALLGHKTSSQAAHYRRHAAKFGLAAGAVARLDTVARTVGLQTPADGTAKRPKRERK